MAIQGVGGVFSSYTYQKVPTQKQDITISSASATDKVSISDAARSKAAAESLTDEPSTAKRLDAIKAKMAVERTDEEVSFLQSKDKKLAEIIAKDSSTWTSTELDYVQKSGGFVNLMSALSDQEKSLYDEMVKQGNVNAAAGMSQIAMIRFAMDGDIILPDGRAFDPNKTEISANNVRNLFRFAFADTSGDIGRNFDALATFLT